MKKVLWAGNYIHDHFYIIKNGRFINKFVAGGIFNCGVDNAENHHVSYGYGEANFLISGYKDSKSEAFVNSEQSVVDFGPTVKLNSRLFEYGYCDWLHIAYLDALPLLDLSQINRKQFGKISCDFCHPKDKLVDDEVIKKNLDYCDVIFDKFGGNTSKLYPYDKWREKSVVILHNAGGSMIYRGSGSGNDSVVFNQKPLDYMFTVGAGDRFAAAFIEAKLNGRYDLDAQVVAHNKVNAWLEKVNNEL